MENSFIRNSTRANGPISTPWSKTSRQQSDAKDAALRRRNLLRRQDPPASHNPAPAHDRLARRTAPRLQLRLRLRARARLGKRRRFDHEQEHDHEQHPVLSSIERWALDVKSWTFSSSFPRRVTGAWWPSRSSKPLLVPRLRDRGRFDS